MSTLLVTDFGAFFHEVHGVEPFPWQQRLVEMVAAGGRWPDVLDLPTGAGKTAALDIAVFHLALEADAGESRRAPVRIALVVDRRLIVDDAFARAERIAAALADSAPGSVCAAVAARLRMLAGPSTAPLVARRLRGGIPREDDWARTPAQPTILCSTVDQVGSRILFRGYGVSDSMKPVHAGLIGADCLILLDEAHLAEPLRQTLTWVAHYRGDAWREAGRLPASPWQAVLLTATPTDSTRPTFELDGDDRTHPILAARMNASKPARLVLLGKPRAGEGIDEPSDRAEAARISALAYEARTALDALRETGVAAPGVAVVVNRVARAREVHAQLERVLADTADVLLMTGAARPADRDDLSLRLAPLRTGVARRPERPFVLVATQCIEAGVDLDLDGLVSDAAPIDTLRQRFGRLNRAGRPILPQASIVAMSDEVGKRGEDPVYGAAIAAAWAELEARSVTSRGKIKIVDFGPRSFDASLEQRPLPPESVTEKPDAPVLLPAHLDLLSQTAPAPASSPDVSLYLHGARRQSASVTLLWRADLDPDAPIDARRLFLLVPPRSAEAIDLPVWAVRRWLTDDHPVADALADVPIAEIAQERISVTRTRRAFRWAGDDARSAWIAARDIRPGDTLVVPAAYGGVDAYGWNPAHHGPAADVADAAAAASNGRRFAVRLAPGMLEPDRDAALAETLAVHVGDGWRTLRDALVRLSLPDNLADALSALDRAWRVEVHLDVYGTDDDGRPRGVVFFAPRGLSGEANKGEGGAAATEDDVAGSLPGFAITLAVHSADVERMAAQFAYRAGLPEPIARDVALAGRLHDLGKADPRWQRWLAFDDPLGADPQNVLAKSARPLPRAAWPHSDLPDRWRHEALSVRLAPMLREFANAHDPDLVLWLVGTHHGHGRPLFPHVDPLDDVIRHDLPPVMGLAAAVPSAPGPQSLAFDWNGRDWAALFDGLKVRYGVWELARLEAILRLADHRASEDEAVRAREGVSV